MHNIFAVGLLAAVTISCLADVFPHTTHAVTRGIGRYEWRIPFNVVSGTPAWFIDTISAVFYKCDYQELVLDQNQFRSALSISMSVRASLWIHSTRVVY